MGSSWGRRKGRTGAGQSQHQEGKAVQLSMLGLTRADNQETGDADSNADWGLKAVKSSWSGEPQGAAKPPGRAGARLRAGLAQIWCVCGQTTSVNSFSGVPGMRAGEMGAPAWSQVNGCECTRRVVSALSSRDGTVCP